MKNKTNFITSETLMNVRPDISVLETQVAKNYLASEYGRKGNCLAVLSPYHEDIYSLEHGCHLVNVFKEGERELDGYYFDDIVRLLTTPVKSLTMQVNPLLPDSPQLVHSLPRLSVEHNPGYWQLVVCGVVKVSDGYVFLRNKDTHPRLPELMTSIQGHVDPSVDMHFMTGIDYFSREFLREFKEEIKFRVSPKKENFLEESTEFKGAIQINTDAVAMEHLGLFFVLDLSKWLSFKHLESNEPEKHELMLVEKNFDITSVKHDSWVPYIINDLL